jgi:hypothetical protein
MALSDQDKARLDRMGYPEIVFIGAVSGQWPKQTFINEGQAMFWLSSPEEENRSKYMIRVNLHTGEVVQVRLKARIVEQELVPVEDE